MKNQRLLVNKMIEQNKIELSKAEAITNEIRENIKYNLYDDELVLM